jgi:hypothetical protein
LTARGSGRAHGSAVFTMRKYSDKAICLEIKYLNK